MSPSSTFYVYLLTNATAMVFYVGMTSNLARRVSEHKAERYDGFTKRYQVKRLVYFEMHTDPHVAIAREKQIKRWKRSWKIDLVRKDNPAMRDLFANLAWD